MSLDTFVQLAKDQGASDLHLEAGLPPAVRLRGTLKLVGEPVSAASLQAMARDLLRGDWDAFVARRSYDLSRVIKGIRCRVNILHSSRGVGMAIRLLAPFQASLKKLNLHPDLAKLVQYHHGLVLVSGPTGSGKTSTLAALLQEINQNEARHIVTVESPIEYMLTPRKSFIRQREVGRDTPSFEQALMDAMREDPDVLMVGEMRDPETMRLTLNASETGHLVFATVHSGSCAEAVQRVVAAFAPEAQANVCAQLADTLVAVICQRLTFRPEQGITVPECEILLGTMGVRAVIRQGQLSKLQTALETGGPDGNWTFRRYREWLDRSTDFYIPKGTELENTPEEPERPPLAPSVAPPRRQTAEAATPRAPSVAAAPEEPQDVLVISDDEGDPADILSELERRR